jgi:formylglycine-generating enzyme required for sulfatase activity
MIRLRLPRLPGQPVHQFEISAQEVTRRQMQAYLEQAGTADDLIRLAAPEPDCPQIRVTWYDAARYCRWLSEQAGLPDDQMCYPTLERIKSGMRMQQNFLQRAGYRLPTEEEWDYACRASATTRRFFGDDELYVGYYGWSQVNADARTRPVGMLKPNPFGLFDVYGNAWEWCHDRAETPWISAALGMHTEEVAEQYYRMLRGGSYYLPEAYLLTSMRIANRPSFLSEDYGFRIARTVPVENLRPAQAEK